MNGNATLVYYSNAGGDGRSTLTGSVREKRQSHGRALLPKLPGFCDLQFSHHHTTIPRPQGFTITKCRRPSLCNNEVLPPLLCGNRNADPVCSKISVANVRQNIKDLLQYSTEEKKRNFTETIELQIGLKNYDPQRYSSSNLSLSPF